MATIDDCKAHILIFLPVMIEMEKMGIDPVEMLFGGRSLTLDDVRCGYIALTRARQKYPLWDGVVDEWMAGLMYKGGDS